MEIYIILISGFLWGGIRGSIALQTKSYRKLNFELKEKLLKKCIVKTIGVAISIYFLIQGPQFIFEILPHPQQFLETKKSIALSSFIFCVGYSLLFYPLVSSGSYWLVPLIMGKSIPTLLRGTILITNVNHPKE